MEVLTNIALENFTKLIAGILAVLTAYVVLKVKVYLNTKIKHDAAERAVKAVEQTFKNSHGKEKFEAAALYARDLLSKCGIKIDDAEMKILIESAVSEFNTTYDKTKEQTPPEIYDEMPVPIEEDNVENVTFTTPKNKIGFAVGIDERKNE